MPQNRTHFQVMDSDVYFKLRVFNVYGKGEKCYISTSPYMGALLPTWIDFNPSMDK